MSYRDKKEKWSVKTVRPEEKFAGKPRMYFSGETVENYEDSSQMKKRQVQMTERALEIAKFEEGSKILDVGCGTGFSSIELEKKGLFSSRD